MISVRDVMNISYWFVLFFNQKMKNKFSVLHPAKPPLDIGEMAYTLRESLLEMELVILRFLRFRMNFKQPHQV